MVFVTFITALSNVIKTFATIVATGASLSPHLLQMHYGKDLIFFSKSAQAKKVSVDI